MKHQFGTAQRQLALFFTLFALLSALVLSARGQDETSIFADESGWQTVISDQINAFRAGNAEAALELAGSGFKRTYQDPMRFMNDVTAMGYEPILRSVSHSFGEFRPLSDSVVLQVVQVIGSDQGYYEALYQLGMEADGWRIIGVALSAKSGVAI